MRPEHFASHLVTDVACENDTNCPRRSTIRNTAVRGRARLNPEPLQSTRVDNRPKQYSFLEARRIYSREPLMQEEPALILRYSCV